MKRCVSNYEEMVAKFWSLVDRRGPDECWLWTSYTDTCGYGGFAAFGRKRKASRVAWEIANGRSLDRRECVLHSCDSPACVNPGHLSVGDQRRNMAEAVERGRHPNANKRFCKRGHPLSGSNLQVCDRGDGRTFRRCVTCFEMRDRAYKKAKRSARRMEMLTQDAA